MRQLTLFNDLILPPRLAPNEAEELLPRLHERGVLIGTDEAGRGALAGPVMSAAVCLTPEQERELLNLGLRDSKLMTPNGRERIFAAMNEMRVSWRACSGSIALIEHENILRASLWAMGQSVERLARLLGVTPACVIVDGNERIPSLSFPQWTLIQADKLIPSVSAASVIAKVIRDRLMSNLDAKYPGYGLSQNKGYPTKSHMEAVMLRGLSDIHRESFCRKIIMRQRKEA